MENVIDIFLFDKDFESGTWNYYTDKELSGKPVLIQGLGELSRVNIFVGSNNSSKSRFMRKLMSEKSRALNEEDHFSNVDSNKYIKYNPSRKTSHLKISEKIPIAIDDNSAPPKSLAKCLGKYINSYFQRESTDPFTSYIQNDMHILGLVRKPITYIYIPLLRSVNPLKFSENKIADEYGDHIKSNIEDMERFSLKIPNAGASNNRVVFTGQLIFEELQQKLLGNWEYRQQVKEYEEFLSRKLFNNQKIELIPKLKDKTVSIKIGNQKERDLYKIGDGVQAIILLTFLLFIYKGRRMVFFIEEPEINLHPGLQRLLLEVMLDKENILPEQQYFF